MIRKHSLLLVSIVYKPVKLLVILHYRASLAILQNTVFSTAVNFRLGITPTLATLLFSSIYFTRATLSHAFPFIPFLNVMTVLQAEVGVDIWTQLKKASSGELSRAVELTVHLRYNFLNLSFIRLVLTRTGHRSMTPGLSTGLLSSSLALHLLWILYSSFLYTSPAPKWEFISGFLFPVVQFLRQEVIGESAGSVPGKNGEGGWTWCPILCSQLPCFGLGLTQSTSRVWRCSENAQEPEPHLTDENLDTPQLRQLGGDLMDHLLELAYTNFS